jgi:hypothetical protein
MVDGETFLYVCAEGHTWIAQTDGGVSPSYGYGGTSHTWPGYEPTTCPEPKHHASGHGYVCPSCGEHFYAGGCSKAHRPPEPACRKPPVATFVWRTGNSRKGISGGWIDVTTRQLTLEGGTEWEQPADAIREIRGGDSA